MHESQGPGREPGDRVVVVRDAVVAAEVLGCDVVASDRAGDPWGPVGVEGGGGAGFAAGGGGVGGDGAAEAVAGHGDAVGGVEGGGGFEGREDARAGFEPAVIAIQGF